MATNYNALTDEQLATAKADLLAKQQSLSAQRAALKEDARLVQSDLDAIDRIERARKLTAGMSAEERAAFAQTINGAGGIASGEAVGTPGGN